MDNKVTRISMVDCTLRSNNWKGYGETYTEDGPAGCFLWCYCMHDGLEMYDAIKEELLQE